MFLHSGQKKRRIPDLTFCDVNGGESALSVQPRCVDGGAARMELVVVMGYTRQWMGVVRERLNCLTTAPSALAAAEPRLTNVMPHSIC